MVRAVAVMAAAFAIFLTVVNVWSLVFNIVSANRFDWLPNNFASVDYFCRPNVNDSSDGRFFQVTEAGYFLFRWETAALPRGADFWQVRI